MNIQFIKQILSKYRNGISIENLKENYLGEISNNDFEQIINNEEIIKINNIVFLRKAFIKQKHEFFIEFNDYLSTKTNNPQLKNDVIAIFFHYISDSLFYQWIGIPLEKKIIIFDLLLAILFKPLDLVDELKKYLNELVEFYASFVIQMLLILNSSQDNIRKCIKLVETIEKDEEVFKKHLFDILTEPYSVNERLSWYKKEFIIAKKNVIKKLKKEYQPILFYSPLLFKRVLKIEIKKFNILKLLTRFNYQFLYEWLINLYELKINSKRNLFKDLGL